MNSFLYYFIRFLFEGMIWLIIIRVVLSWVPIDPYSPMVRMLREITDPVLEPFRRLIPPIGGFDFSPIVALFVLEFLEQFLLRMMYR
jgi:YggT family protein